MSNISFKTWALFLNHFFPIFWFYTLWKHQKIKSFLLLLITCSSIFYNHTLVCRSTGQYLMFFTLLVTIYLLIITDKKYANELFKVTTNEAFSLQLDLNYKIYISLNTQISVKLIAILVTVYAKSLNFSANIENLVF